MAKDQGLLDEASRRAERLSATMTPEEKKQNTINGLRADGCARPEEHRQKMVDAFRNEGVENADEAIDTIVPPLHLVLGVTEEALESWSRRKPSDSKTPLTQSRCCSGGKT